MPPFAPIRPWINGQFVDATSGKSFPNLNPANNEVICEIQQSSDNDVENAVRAASLAFKTWSKMKGADRGRILYRAAQLLRERLEELAKLEVIDTGKPIQEALDVDIISGAECLEYFAGVAPTLHGHHYDLGESFAYTRREPLGVCAAIGAWNYPIQIACWKAAPALACGNTMVYKPSEVTPMTAMKLAEIFKEAGLPDGVFNVVPGDGHVGKLLTSHPKIRKVSLTGSVPTGKRIMEASAPTLKHITLELGGKSPFIVFEDADLDNAVSACMLSNFYTQGEICSNGTRVFVHENVHEQFLSKIIPRVKNLVIGDPMDPKTQVGALISKPHMEKVLSYIEIGKQAGAKLLIGGNRYTGNPRLTNGNFVEPTIFAEVTDDMKICQEEIFGPVMCVLKFKNEEEVIERANNTKYGLAAGVFTRDLSRGHRVVARLESGTCWINNYNITPIEMPFGGYKESGFGRENSLAAIEHYTQLKTVYVELGNVVSTL
ncbi:uncharacterized protein VTP21DRAFT_8031 [Calcarisporiella thermophila]|uniref:uncharacterized protein n=1 Tax=Calcarisporiella thermophila TaxID=911321 RepID=UPI0037432749